MAGGADFKGISLSLKPTADGCILYLHASGKKNYKKDDIKAGGSISERVLFVHLVERIYESATITVHGHCSETDKHSLEHKEH